MNKNASVASRAHRTVKRLKSFDSSRDFLTVLVDKGLQLKSNEEYIGTYLNHGDTISEAVVVTGTSIHLFSEIGWDAIDYSEIEKAVVLEEKQNAADVHLHRKNHGRTLVVPIRGHQARVRDVFEFLRFFNRIVEDQRSD